MTRDQLVGTWKWIGINLGGHFRPHAGGTVRLDEDGTAVVTTPMADGSTATEAATWAYVDESHWNLSLVIPGTPDIPGLEEESVSMEECEVKSFAGDRMELEKFDVEFRFVWERVR